MRIGIALMAATLEVAAMAMFGLTETHHDILGTTGAIAVLIAVAAAVLAGPLVGCLTAMLLLGHPAPLLISEGRIESVAYGPDCPWAWQILSTARLRASPCRQLGASCCTRTV